MHMFPRVFWWITNLIDFDSRELFFRTDSGRGLHTWHDDDDWSERKGIRTESRDEHMARLHWQSDDRPKHCPLCVIIGASIIMVVHILFGLVLLFLAEPLNRFKVRPPDRDREEEAIKSIHHRDTPSANAAPGATLSSNWALEYDEFQHTKHSRGRCRAG